MRIRNVRSTTVAALTALAVAAPVGAAFADSHDAAAAKPAKLTVKSYQAYLKQQKTPAAHKTLVAFRALPKGKQATFVKQLQNREAYLALSGSSKGGIKTGARKSTVSVNKAVSITRASKVVSGTGKHRPTAISYTLTEKIFGIPVTSERVTVKYQLASKGKAKKIVKPSAKSKVVNTNAAIAISGPKVVKTVAKGSGVTARATFRAVPQVKSFGKKVVKDGTLRASHTAAGSYWSYSLNNR
ncbi:hypothetical protein [Streptomyces sp. MZ04]|uniref:hypothetical protein n=1 Tax=Streptomyces sp. MZ04 TaxID=2559236 RepID=UPI00107E76D7|nr:hypothetical protein [Streptomyces sp. MZ04]TGB09250.1 hypothetical protein E2651_16795 [Streptomyces sp. MZ04]